MSKTLPPVDDEVFAGLQDRAEPLVDDINSVLRRLLGLPVRHGSAHDRSGSPALAVVPPKPRAGDAAERRGSRSGARSKKRASKAKKPRAVRGSILPEADYELPILKALTDLGNRAPASEVVDRVGEILADRLQPSDHEPLASGDIRWRNRVQFVRLKLIQTGDMVKDSPRGVWEISEQGRQRIAGAA